jgi:hypothetical protein
MAIRTEITLRLPNSPGAVESVCRTLAAEHVDILALSLEPTGRLHLVVDSPGRAARALEERHQKTEARDVIVVPVPFRSADVAATLALVSSAGINIDYAYAAGAEGPSSGGILVLSVEDAMRAATATGL